MDKLFKPLVKQVGNATSGIVKTPKAFGIVTQPDKMKQLENNASSNLDVS